jgi:predicted ATP-grasp superfamily ATP-dependent carboligase
VKKILLASVVDWDSLGELPAIFKRGGCLQVDLLCNKDTWLTSNRYYDNWIEIKDGTVEVSKQIIQLAQDKTKNYDRVILLDDLIIRLMNESVESEDLFKKILPLTKIENREMLSSKAGFSNVCERNNILSPKFILYSDSIDFSNNLERMNYPLLLKQDLSWSGAGIQFCYDKNSLEEGLTKIAVKENLVVQEYITGEDIGVEALFHKGQLITYNVAKILDYFETKFSYTTRRVYFRDKEIEGLLKILGKSVGLNGFASISYIFEPNQHKYYLIEVDTRLNNWMTLSHFTGHSFSEGISRIIEAGNNPAKVFADKSEDFNKEIEIALFYRDLRRCWKKKDLKGVMRWLFNYKGYWRFIPLYDGLILRKMFGEIKKDFVKIGTKS